MNYTPQEIFDTVVNHLKTQRRPAIIPGGTCQYLTDTGLKCAVGCLIDDPKLAKRMDDLEIDNTSAIAVEGLLPGHLKPHLDLLDRLQRVHDRSTTGPRTTTTKQVSSFFPSWPRTSIKSPTILVSPSTERHSNDPHQPPRSC